MQLLNRVIKELIMYSLVADCDGKQESLSENCAYMRYNCIEQQGVHFKLVFALIPYLKCLCTV